MELEAADDAGQLIDQLQEELAATKAQLARYKVSRTSI
jgi:uncharacterized small protein (DUF1192 family)